MTKGFWVVCLLLLVVAQPTSRASDEPRTRVVVVAGEGARGLDAKVMARLDAALTGLPNIILVERRKVGIEPPAIESDQAPAAGNRDGDGAHEGHMADVLVVVDRVPGEAPFICRVQVTEPRGGVVLIGGLFSEEEVGADPQPVVDIIRNGIEKYGIPPEDRHYLAIVGIRNEDPSDTLEGLSRTLNAVLPVSLQHCPSIVLVDREHGTRLAGADRPGAAEATAVPAAILLEGGLRRGGGGPNVIVTLLLTPSGGGEPKKLEIPLAPDRADSFGDTVVAALTECLGVEPPAIHPDPEAEGRRFIEQARLLTIAGDKEAALAAAEAAYALWPTALSRMNLAFAASNLTLDGIQSEQLVKSLGWRRDGGPYFEGDDAARARSLVHEARVLELVLEQLRLEMNAEPPRGAASGYKESLRLRAFLGASPGLGRVTRPTPDGAESLHRQVESSSRALFEVMVARVKENTPRHGHEYWEILGTALTNLRLWGGNITDPAIAQEQADGLKELFALCEFEGGRDNFQYASFTEQFLWKLDSLVRLRKHAEHDTRPIFATVFQKNAEHRDPAIRVLASHGLVCLDVDGTAAAVRIMNEMTTKDLGNGIEPRHRALMIDKALALLEEKGEERQALALCERLVEPVEADPTLGTWWLPWAWNWFRLAKSVSGDDAAEVVRTRVLAIYRTRLEHLPARGRPGLTQERTSIEAAIRTAESWGRTMAAENHEKHPWSAGRPDDPWRHYEVLPLELGLRGQAGRALVHDDRLYVIGFTDGGRGAARLIVTVHRFPQGGPPVRQAMIRLPDGTGRSLFPAILDGTLFVGTSAGIAVFTTKDTLELLTEADGLPGTGIGAMAAYGDKLYLGIADGKRTAFVEYAPAAKTSRTIFSNVAVEPARRRDFEVTFLLADTVNGCLWVIGDRPRLWRYAPTTDIFEATADANGIGQVFPRSEGPLPVNGGLLRQHSSTTRFLELPSGRTTLLIDRPHNHGKPRYDFVPPPNKSGPAPIWYDGDTLVAYAGWGKPALYLFQPDTPPAARGLPDGVKGWRNAVAVTEAGPILMGENGEGYLIRRRANAPERVRDEAVAK